MTRTLGDALRGRSAEELTALFAAREDLISPPPHDLADLLARATARASIRRCLDRLDAWRLAVLESLCALGEGTAAEIDALRLAAHGRRPARRTTPGVTGALADLEVVALVWSDARRWRVPLPVREEFGRFPLGLAPRTDVPAERPPFELDALAADEAAVVRRLAAGPPVGTVRAIDASTPVGRLIERGILRQVDDQTVQLPRESALQVRRLDPADPVAAAPEPFLVTGRPRRIADQAGVGTAVETLADVETLLDELDRSPVGLLRNGGIGMRDLTRLARRTGRDAARTGFELTLVHAAGLATRHGSTARLTTAADRWLSAPPVERWATLVLAWLEAPWWPSDTPDGRHPWAEADREPGRSVRPAGDPIAPSTLRRQVLERLAEGADDPSGRTERGVDPAALARALTWHRPALARGDRLRLAAVLLDLTWLGLVALETVTDPVPAVLSATSPEDLVAAASGHFPEPVDRVILQADLTAVAPGPLVHDVGQVMRRIARIESRGGATVYRFTEQSLQRALDRGWSQTDLLDWLAQHATSAVPQPLTYLVADAARHHGRVQVGTASSWVTLDDPAHMAHALSDARAARLGVQRISDTVIVAAAEAEEMVAWLRDLGLSPASSLPAPAPERAPTPVRHREVPHPDPGSVAERLVAHATAAATSAELPARLEAARAEGRRLEVAYVDGDGTRRTIAAVPMRVSDGSVLLVGSGRRLSLPIARVLSIGGTPGGIA